jgi:aspartyl aminopeptidase
MKRNPLSDSESGNSHHLELLEAVCAEAKKSPSQVVNVDLCLYDTQSAVISGVKEEFIHSARLDNLFMSYCTLESLLASVNSGMDGSGIRAAILFDHEEIGSQSAQGADSSIIEVILRRIIGSLEPKASLFDSFPRIVSRSLLVSADMAHAVHPNYAEKHEECHRPRMHKGLVIKYNSNQRYATSPRSAAYFKTLSARAGIPVQEFMVRNDSPCGSTIGPILSSKLGMPAIDVGVAQLSMHSIREMAGVDDVEHSINLFSAFYSQNPLEFEYHNP